MVIVFVMIIVVIAIARIYTMNPISNFITNDNNHCYCWGLVICNLGDPGLWWPQTKVLINKLRSTDDRGLRMPQVSQKWDWRTCFHWVAWRKFTFGHLTFQYSTLWKWRWYLKKTGSIDSIRAKTFKLHFRFSQVPDVPDSLGRSIPTVARYSCVGQRLLRQWGWNFAEAGNLDSLDSLDLAAKRWNNRIWCQYFDLRTWNMWLEEYDLILLGFESDWGLHWRWTCVLLGVDSFWDDRTCEFRENRGHRNCIGSKHLATYEYSFALHHPIHKAPPFEPWQNEAAWCFHFFSIAGWWFLRILVLLREVAQPPMDFGSIFSTRSRHISAQ